MPSQLRVSRWAFSRRNMSCRTEPGSCNNVDLCISRQHRKVAHCINKTTGASTATNADAEGSALVCIGILRLLAYLAVCTMVPPTLSLRISSSPAIVHSAGTGDGVRLAFRPRSLEDLAIRAALAATCMLPGPARVPEQIMSKVHTHGKATLRFNTGCLGLPHRLTCLCGLENPAAYLYEAHVAMLAGLRWRLAARRAPLRSGARCSKASQLPQEQKQGVGGKFEQPRALPASTVALCVTSMRADNARALPCTSVRCATHDPTRELSTLPCIGPPTYAPTPNKFFVPCVWRRRGALQTNFWLSKNVQ